MGYPDKALVAKWREAGLTVVELPGWEQRGRPTGSYSPRGNLHHHVGSSGNGIATVEWMALEGRPDLPAPLCQMSTDRQGVIYVCAAGRANHAGVARAFGRHPSGDGNALYMGWEHQNNGIEGWPKVQYEAMVLAAAIAGLHYGWAAADNPAHRETSVTGKWDPGALDMTRFREDIAAAMRNERAPKMTPIQIRRLSLGKRIAGLSEELEGFDALPESKTIARLQRAKVLAARGLLVSAHRSLDKRDPGNRKK